MQLEGETILAPLTRGGNLPFRRLCVEFGARITTSEMAYSRQVVRGSRTELALLRRHASEPCFGVQLAASNPDDAVAAGAIAVERGAAFVDVNAGCPIHDTIKRGMGATLLQRPAALARIVAALRAALPVPITVKLRSGWHEDQVNASEVAQRLEEAGAHALTLHARTREQRYTRAADWDLIARLVRERSIPIVGNGDVLTHYEARDRRAQSGCAAVMVARGALIKPWLFREIAEDREWLPTATERVAVYFRFVQLAKEHFRDDAKGRKSAMYFLPWHFDFFCRYRPFPAERWHAASRTHPLLQTRHAGDGPQDDLERLLRDARPEVHVRLADALWDSTGPDDAVARLAALARELPPGEVEAPEIAVSTG